MSGSPTDGAVVPRTWTRPELVSVDRLPMRSPLVAAPDRATARRGREASPWFLPLNGDWAFRFHERPEDVEPDAVAARTGLARWDRVGVPGNWTRQGYDRPHYTNVHMPFGGRPPEVPAANPTGVYARDIELPASWQGRRVVLHVGGAESVLYVWVNGRFVGMGTDSRLAGEWDVTTFVKPGRNRIALAVVRWSAGSYVEDQDHWWMAGLHREVFLRATDQVHLEDVRVDAGLADDLTTGTLRVRTTVGFERAADIGPGWRVEAALETLAGRRVGRPLAGAVPHDLRPYLFRGHEVDVRTDVPDVRVWSAEHPERYRIVVRLLDPTGAEREVVTQTIGFRRVEVRDRRLLINGQAVMIRGVNRHDHHPVRGKAVTVDDMRTDLLAMKRLNVNAVRCSHYPNDPRFLDLCDELGFYVVDESDIESHAFNDSLCHDPRYRSTWLERGSRMAQRDKNHPCVIAWSLGNESGYGENHDALAGWIRRYDPTRVLHYEGAIFNGHGTGDFSGGEPATDLVCPMYPTIEHIVRWARTSDDRHRPMILCEYSHAMGNSNGSLADYWDAFEAEDGLQGGFVWEWKDHGLRQELDHGGWRYAYGGQFGDEPNDRNFVADGLVGPAFEPHPVLQELTWVHRPVRITDVDVRAGRVRVENRQWFSGLDAFRAEWELSVDGRVVQRGRLPLPDVAPTGAADVRVPLRRVALAAGQEAHLLVRVVQRSATPWAPAGHVVAWDQLPVPWRAAVRRPIRPEGEVDASDRDGALTVRGGDTVAVVDLGTASLVSLRHGRRELLAGAPRLELYRAPTDNDGLKLFDDPRGTVLERWRAWGLDRLARRVVERAWRADGDRVIVTARHQLTGADGAVAQHHQTLTFLPTGDVLVDDLVELPDAWDDVARVGHSFRAAATLGRVAWFGLGPVENEPDRNRGAVLGRYEQRPDELPYLMPQDFGTRTGTRWFAVAGARAGLLVVPVTPGTCSFSATHHTTEDLAAATDWTDLVRRDELAVHVDMARRGVGTASCGPDTLPAYRVPAGPHRLRWRLRPYGAAQDPGALAAAVVR